MSYEDLPLFSKEPKSEATTPPPQKKTKKRKTKGTKTDSKKSKKHTPEIPAEESKTTNQTTKNTALHTSDNNKTAFTKNIYPPTATSVNDKTTPLSVSSVTQKIKQNLESEFTDIWVTGEISNYRPAASGHAYFSIKDKTATLSVAIFNWNKRKTSASFKIQDGIEVLCHGNVSVYPPRGSYQLIADRVEPLGAGALQIAFEQLKAKLYDEGLFAPENKREIPSFPNRIAVITSPSGAAIRDMLNILGRRAPNIRVSIIPALVQGAEAALQIRQAVEFVNKHNLGDILILTRGGGSIEDLWCFNDEELARIIAKSEIPTISAVGHEIDFTISDFVADLRAPTPSAAAELVSTNWVDITQSLNENKIRLTRNMKRDLEKRFEILKHISARLISPKDKLREQAQRIDELFLRLDRSVDVLIDKRQSIINQWESKLEALSPLKVLKRGYAIVKDANSANVIKSSKHIQNKQTLELNFHDGKKLVTST